MSSIDDAKKTELQRFAAPTNNEENPAALSKQIK